MIKILIKRLNKKAKIPKFETSGSSGMDLSACIEDPIEIKPGNKALIPTGLAIAVPKGYEAQIRPRSGLAIKKGISVLNTPGTIDSDYRGELKVILINLGNERFTVENDSRIAQMVICPVVNIQFEEVKELSETTRGQGGFGSTGV